MTVHWSKIRWTSPDLHMLGWAPTSIRSLLICSDRPGRRKGRAAKQQNACHALSNLAELVLQLYVCVAEKEFCWSHGHSIPIILMKEQVWGTRFCGFLSVATTITIDPDTPKLDLWIHQNKCRDFWRKKHYVFSIWLKPNGKLGLLKAGPPITVPWNFLLQRLLHQVKLLPSSPVKTADKHMLFEFQLPSCQAEWRREQLHCQIQEVLFWWKFICDRYLIWNPPPVLAFMTKLAVLWYQNTTLWTRFAKQFDHKQLLVLTDCSVELKPLDLFAGPGGKWKIYRVLQTL